MKNKTSIWISVAVILLILLWIVLTFNSLVKKQESVKSQWAQVETQYQRRIDLIPNLVDVTKGYMQFESSLLQNITELRSRWIDAKSSEEKINTEKELDSAISRLLVVYENYPELRSIEAVSGLMDELSGTENRIAFERQRYNLAVKDYNVAIKTFPNMIVAGILGYGEEPYYESVEGADNVPPAKIY